MNNFNKNDYETPDWLAQEMASMLLYSDDYILEPCAGTGQILKAIISRMITADNVYWCEKNKDRAAKLPQWIKCRGYDFLKTVKRDIGFDLIITNPPFDYALEFIEHSLKLLNDESESRLIYLLPIDIFSSKARAQHFQQLDCHISNITIVPGRVDYLKNGVPVSKTQKVVDGVLQYGKNGKPIMCSGRQVSDAIFTIKKGKGSLVNFVYRG